METSNDVRKYVQNYNNSFTNDRQIISIDGKLINENNQTFDEMNVKCDSKFEVIIKKEILVLIPKKTVIFNEIEYNVQDLINLPCYVSTTCKNPVNFAWTIIGIYDYGENVIFTVKDCNKDISQVKMESISLDMSSNMGKRRRIKTNFYAKNNDIIISNNTTGRQKKEKQKLWRKKLMT